MSGGSPSTSNTVTTSQSIPEFEQQASQRNQALAESIGSQPYPVYQGALVQPMDALQQQGEQQAVGAAGSYQPYLDAATAETGNAINTNASTPGAIQSFMNPYEQQALAPQIQDLQLQQGQQQLQINQQATQDAAFGDARQGSAQALQNLYGNQALNQLVGTGYNNAYNSAQQALQTQQGAEQTGANALATIGGQQQSLGETGAGAVYTAGQQQQQQGQQELSTAYQQFLNQVNWPTQMLNIQESALSNSPYNLATAVTLPQGNSVAQGFGGLSSLAGLLGSSGAGASGGAGNVFGAA